MKLSATWLRQTDRERWRVAHRNGTSRSATLTARKIACSPFFTGVPADTELKSQRGTLPNPRRDRAESMCMKFLSKTWCALETGRGCRSFHPRPGNTYSCHCHPTRNDDDLLELCLLLGTLADGSLGRSIYFMKDEVEERFFRPEAYDCSRDSIVRHNHLPAFDLTRMCRLGV